MPSPRRHGRIVFRRRKNKGFFLATFAGVFLFTVFIAKIDRIVYFFEPELSVANTSPAQLGPSKSTTVKLERNDRFLEEMLYYYLGDEEGISSKGNNSLDLFQDLAKFLPEKYQPPNFMKDLAFNDVSEK